MNTLNLVVFGLIVLLAGVLLGVHSELARILEDHSVMLLLAIGGLSLVVAREREKVPDQQP